MKRLKQRIPAVGLVCALMYGNVAQAQWQIDLEPPSKGFYQPSDTYSFVIPAGMPAAALQRIRLELDNIDVSAFIQREGNKAIFAPPEALSYGPHQLRLVEYTDDGSINELALWTAQVRKTAAFRQADARANLNLTSNQRIADKNVSSGLPSNTRQAGLAAEGQIADDDWHLNGNIGVLHNSQPGMMPRGNRTDLANVLIEGQRGNVALRAGDHMLPATNLILRDFARRGVSGTARLDTLRADVTAFAMRTDKISGFRHGFGVGDSDNRTDGVTINLSQFSDRPERLQIAATLLRAHGNPGGVAVLGDAEGSEGNASSLAIDSLLYEQRLRLRGELARTRSDLDGTAATLGNESDNAHSLLAQYTHPYHAVRDAAFSWNVGTEQSMVGPDFYSLANPVLPADKRMQRVFSGFNWGGWAVNAQLARETDNVDRDPNLPRMRSDYHTLGSNYTPQWEPVPKGFMQLFNSPGLALLLQDMSQHYDSMPLGFGGNNVDQATRVLYAGLRFVPGTWAWNISHVRTRFDDAVGLQADYTNNLTEFGFDILLGERYSLRPRIQFNKQQDHDNRVLTQSTNAGLGMSAGLIPGKLDTSLDYSLNRGEASDNSVQTNTYLISGMLNWQVRTAGENHPGISLFASGSYIKDRNAVSTDGVIYQIFAGLRIAWPVTY
jgi:hypothetical protein